MNCLVCKRPFDPVAPGQDTCVPCMARPIRSDFPAAREKEEKVKERKCAKAGCDNVFTPGLKQYRRVYCDEHVGDHHGSGGKHRRKATPAKRKPETKPAKDAPGVDRVKISFQLGGVLVQTSAGAIHITGQNLEVAIIKRS